MKADKVSLDGGSINRTLLGNVLYAFKLNLAQ